MIILARAILYFGEVMSTALIIRALLSWFVRSGNQVVGKIYEILFKVTEPLVSPVRNFMMSHFNTGMFDFSILVTMILIEIVTRLVFRLLVMFI